MLAVEETITNKIVELFNKKKGKFHARLLYSILIKFWYNPEKPFNNAV